MKVKSLSRVRLFATPWTAAYQAPSPIGFSRQEYWSGVPLPSPTNLAGVFKFIPTTCEDRLGLLVSFILIVKNHPYFLRDLHQL